jgi:hypothetical protein
LVKGVGVKAAMEGLPKPSQGGYIVEVGKCEWKEMA